MQCGLGDPRQGAALGVDMSRQVGLFVAALKGDASTLARRDG